jgi:hypothetical protein
MSSREVVGRSLKPRRTRSIVWGTADDGFGERMAPELMHPAKRQAPLATRRMTGLRI